MEHSGEPTDQESDGQLTERDARRTELATRLRRLDNLADLMDNQFQVPFIRYRIGLDPLIGVLPGGGDWVTWAASAYIIWEAAGLGVPTRILARMAGYSAIDLVVGYVPIAGDLFDATYKCNRRNVDLLKSHFGLDPRQDVPSRLPEDSPDTPTGLASYLPAIAIVTGLLALAALPFILLWWFLQ